MMKGDQWNSHLAVIKLDISTGISKTLEKNSAIYPNPTTGIINLSGFVQPERLNISDITGKIVFTVENPDSQIDLSGLEKGVYFVSIYTSGKNYKEKIIIQ